MTTKHLKVIVLGFELGWLTFFPPSTARAQSPYAERGTNATAGRRIEQLLDDVRFKKATWKWKGSEGGLNKPTFRGQPLSDFFRNKSSAGTNQLTLDEMFTLRRVITGDEPEVVSYQLPISFDALASVRSVTNAFPAADLMLLMDSEPEGSFLNHPELNEISRATNGDCLLVWNTAFERPDQHAMQALLQIELGWDKGLEIKGPVKPFFSNNLFQFNPGSSLWDDTGAFLDAYNLLESNAVYSIEIKTRSGAHVKTLSGRTTNGVIHVDWDLLDDYGRKYTNNSFVSHFNITLPSSGRSQTLKQPQNKLGTPGD